MRVGIITVKTNEAGKTLALTANVASVFKLCNIEDVNTDWTTFVYDPEAGEFTNYRKGLFTIEGTLYLISGTDEVADLTIDLYLNGVQHQRLYTGINNQRILHEFKLPLESSDVLKIMVTCPYDITIETDTPENYITIKRVI